MSKARKLRVGVIFGGRSSEHDVSLMSARSVMAALDPTRYDVVPIGITRAGSWLAGDALLALTDGSSTGQAATLLPDPAAGRLMTMAEDATGTAVTLSAVAELDVLFPVLHGPYGEDGTVQGLLELADLPYVGAGVVGSAVGMDKAIFKHVMAANGLPVVPWRLITSQQWAADRELVLDDLAAALRFPLFTKPANLGSSVGISKCHDRRELAVGLDDAAAYDRRLVVEEGRTVRELEVAILGNEAPIASIVGEIRPRRAFYDYVAKYVSDDSELLIPAPLDEETAVQVREMSLAAYKAIDCAGLGRVDLLLDTDSGELFLNEINTIPGFTQISMYPKLWEASGMSYAELLDRLLALALERHEEKSRRQPYRQSMEMSRD